VNTVTDRDRNEAQAQDTASVKDEAIRQQQQQRNERIAAAYKGLAAQGFSKEQAAQQLSAKYAMTVADVTGVLDAQEPDNAERDQSESRR